MRNFKYIILLMAVVFFNACSPKIDVRDLPTNPPKTDVIVDKTDPNQPVLSVDDETVFTANWDFGNGILLQGKSVQGFFPLKGDYKYTLTAMNGAGSSVVEGTVNVAESNPSMVYGIPEYAALVGAEGDGGKYWIFDQAISGGGEDVSFMTADYDSDEFWWNPYAGEAGADLPDYMNEMKFDLEGGFNYTREDGLDAAIESGSFVLNITEMTLQFVGANIPNYNDPNLSDDITSTGLYKIKSINDYELVLWQNDATNGYGWTWKFKARDMSGDNPLNTLAGEAGEGGKTWEFNQDAPGEDVSYMTANYNWEEFWWNPYAGDDGASLPDLDNNIKFELDGTYTRFATDGSEIEKGTYVLNTADMIITFTDAHIPNYNDGNLDVEVVATNVYKIQVLEDDKLLLWQDQSSINPDDYDYAWAWEFKPKG